MKSEIAMVTLAAAALVCFAAPSLTEGRQNADENRGGRGILYLAGAYQFVEIDLRTNAVKTWPLLKLAGLDDDAPECAARHAPISCDWHASETRLDLKSGRMYFVTPADNPGDEAEAGDEDDPGPRRFVVWVVGLADLKPVKTVEIPFAQKNMPTIVLSQDGKKLLVAYEDKDGKSRDVETIDTKAFVKESEVKDSSGEILNAYFPTGTYFTTNDKFMVSGDFRIWKERGQFRSEYLDPRAKLPAEETKRLSGFLKAVGGKTFLPAAAAGSVKGTTLEMVVNEAVTESAFWTVDMETGTTSPAVLPKYLARGELLGKGEEIALLEERPKSASQDTGNRFEKTGHVVIYNVKSGAKLREFMMPALEGVGEMLCSNADGSLAAYGHGRDELMILDLKAGRVTRVVGKFDRMPQPRYIGACEFGE